MKYDYYLHRSGGKIFDCLNGIGHPFRVGVVRYFVYKWLGYKATRVKKGVSIKRVIIRATLAAGAHRNSYAMRKVKES